MKRRAEELKVRVDEIRKARDQEEKRRPARLILSGQ